jgi:hypothetical protein
MYLNKVVTGLRIFDPMGVDPIKEPYFVLEGSAHEAAGFIGQLTVSPSMMNNFLEWLMPEYQDQYVLLVSLDGRRGLPFAAKAIEFVGDGEEVIELNVHEDYHPYELKRLVRDFKNYVSINPELALRLGYLDALSPQKRRVRFTGVGADVRPGDIDRQIQSALRSLESATDDALVWLAIAGPKNQSGVYPFDYSDVMREIELRQSKGSEFHSTFFPLDKVHMQEIFERQQRAELLFGYFERTFNNELGRANHEEIEKWIRTLNNDLLGELAVYSYYSGAGLMGEWKFFVGAFQARMKPTIIY